MLELSDKKFEEVMIKTLSIIMNMLEINKKTSFIKEI